LLQADALKRRRLEKTADEWRSHRLTIGELITAANYILRQGNSQMSSVERYSLLYPDWKPYPTDALRRSDSFDYAGDLVAGPMTGDLDARSLQKIGVAPTCRGCRKEFEPRGQLREETIPLCRPCRRLYSRGVLKIEAPKKTAEKTAA
jgi:hypothetical protein